MSDIQKLRKEFKVSCILTLIFSVQIIVRGIFDLIPAGPDEPGNVVFGWLMVAGGACLFLYMILAAIGVRRSGGAAFRIIVAVLSIGALVGAVCISGDVWGSFFYPVIAAGTAVSTETTIKKIHNS